MGVGSALRLRSAYEGVGFRLRSAYEWVGLLNSVEIGLDFLGEERGRLFVEEVAEETRDGSDFNMALGDNGLPAHGFAVVPV